MRMMVLTGLAAVSLSACATTPKVQAQYYFPKAESRVQVTQTLACDNEKKNMIVGNSGSITTSYSANRDKTATFAFSDVSSAWANGDNTFTFTDDGRLKSVNSSSTGKGDAIVTAAITLGKVAVTAAGGGAAIAGAETPCDVIDKHGGGKPITLTYAGALDYKAPRPPKADAASTQLYNRLVAAGATLPVLSVTLVDKGKLRPAAAYEAWKDQAEPKADGKVVPLLLSAHKLYEARLKVTDSNGTEELWSGGILVPDGQFALPIPTAKFFGKQSFAIALSEAGTITSISYGTESGAALGLGSAAAVGTALQGDSDTVKAAAAKGSADLIVQQNRLVACRAKPDTCT